MGIRSQGRRRAKIGLYQSLIYRHPFPSHSSQLFLFAPLQLSKKNPIPCKKKKRKEGQILAPLPPPPNYAYGFVHLLQAMWAAKHLTTKPLDYIS